MSRVTEARADGITVFERNQLVDRQVDDISKIQGQARYKIVLFSSHSRTLNKAHVFVQVMCQCETS